MNDREQAFPWYKELWVWFFLGILGMGIIAGTTMFIIGVSNPPEMVVGDYARFARGLVDTNQRASRAMALGLKGELVIADQTISIDLSKTSDEPWPTTVLVLFQHPASSDQDMTVRLTSQGNGRYQAELSQLPNPRARAIVIDLAQTWWLSTPDHSLLTLGTVTLLPHRL